MFGRLLRRAAPEDVIAPVVYGAIVAQARNPVFYSDLGVPDTVTGRFEMVVLHLGLLLDRLQGTEADKTLGQKVFDLYCIDMDRSLRELGVGDLAVPKRMRKMTEAFYGRARAYRQAMADGGDTLHEAIARNVFGGDASASGSAPLAAYARASAAALSVTPSAVIAAGSVPFAAITSGADARAAV
jgi:cytochrome b pre-mRNA-processing protein 3